MTHWLRWVMFQGVWVVMHRVTGYISYTRCKINYLTLPVRTRGHVVRSRGLNGNLCPLTLCLSTPLLCIPTLPMTDFGGKADLVIRTSGSLCSESWIWNWFGSQTSRLRVYTYKPSNYWTLEPGLTTRHNKSLLQSPCTPPPTPAPWLIAQFVNVKKNVTLI